jgi:hypothetical protein
LLHTLDSSEDVETLEAAVCAHQCGRFADAEHSFIHDLPESHTLPILALEHADMLTAQSRQHERIALLQKTLDNLDAWSEKAVGGEEHLLRLMLKDAEYWAYGKLKPALEEAQNLRRWLSGESVNDLTDIHVCSIPCSQESEFPTDWNQVRCILLYFQIVRSCKQVSNWVKDEEDGVVFADLGHLPWTELTTVREKLKSKGKVMLAVQIAKADVSRREGSALQALCQETINLCDQLEATGQDSMRYRASNKYDPFPHCEFTR